MKLTTRETAYVHAYVRHAGDEALIAKDLEIHPSQLKALGRVPAVMAAVESAREGWSHTPTEPELLAEVLQMARKANAVGQYSAAMKAYGEYGQRMFRWTNRTEVTGQDGGPIEINATQLRDELEQRFSRLAVGSITAELAAGGTSTP